MVNEYSKQSHRYTEGNKIGSTSWTGYIEKGRSLDNTVGGQPAGKSLKRRVGEALLDSETIVGYRWKDFQKNYLKLNPKYKIVHDKKDNIYYGFKKGTNIAHWKYFDDRGELFINDKMDARKIMTGRADKNIFEAFGFTGVPFPSETPNEFAYLDFKKWVYKNRGKLKKDLQKYNDTKIFKRIEYWWTIWDKKANKGEYSNIRGNKFGRELIRMMWSDNLLFDKKSNKIIKLQEGSITGTTNGEPETGFLKKGTTRKLGNVNKPDHWFDGGGWTQLDFPSADDIYGPGVEPDLQAIVITTPTNQPLTLKEIMMENYDLEDHPKKKWITQKLASINPEIMDELFRMYSAVYSAEGMQLSAFSASELQSSYQIVMLIDIDKDPMPDAFIFTRGNRVKLLATDGQKLSKSLVIRKVVKMVNSGYNLEASAKMETIMKAKGAPYIDDENRIKNMVGSKFIEYLGDGYYKRKLKKGGTVVKRMYGK